MEGDIQPKSWFNRNWKWVVPVGGCSLIIIAIIVFAGSLIWGVSSLMSDSQAYKDAMVNARSNSVLVDRIGEPIETHGMSSGSIDYSNGVGSADLRIPIEGPKGKAIILVIGSGTGENWKYELMEVHFEEKDEVIDLLAKTFLE